MECTNGWDRMLKTKMLDYKDIFLTLYFIIKFANMHKADGEDHP